MGWKFVTATLALQLAIIGCFGWVYTEAARKEKLIEGIAGIERYTTTVLAAEVLNYHFAKKHSEDPPTCSKCQAIYKKVGDNILDFYENNE